MQAATNTQPPRTSPAFRAALEDLWRTYKKPVIQTDVGPAQPAFALHFHPLWPTAAQTEGQAIDSNRRNPRIHSPNAPHSQRAPTPSTLRGPQTGSESGTIGAAVHTPASPEILRGQHASLADGEYIVHEPVDLEQTQLIEENLLGPEFKQLPDDAQKDIAFLVTRFAYKASVMHAGDNSFNILFHKEDERVTRRNLPPQLVQRVYFAANHHPVLVTFDVPLSAPLYWKVSKASDKRWELLEEILHCPDPDRFPMQHRMWRLFHDHRRQKLVQEYLEIGKQEQNGAENNPTHLGDCAELGLYMFSIGRPPRVWTVGGDKSESVGFPEGSRSCFGGCMFTYDEADVLLLTETEHAIWAAHNNAPKNILLFDEAFNRRRPGKSMAAWLQELDAMAEEEPSTTIDIQDLASPKYDEHGNATLAVRKMTIQLALELYHKFDPERPVSVANPPSNFLNITDEQPGHWPEGLCKRYSLLRQLVQQVESRQYSRYQDTEGMPDTGKPRITHRTPVDMSKCQQFRIAAAAGAASDFHMDQSGVYTFVHLEKNTDDGKESAEDAIKYWPSYRLDGLSQAEQDTVRMEFAASSKSDKPWRPRPSGGIPVLIILGGYMLIQRPGNIHAPITLTSCFFLGGMAWKDSTLKDHLEISKFLAANPGCTNEALPSQIQPILLALRSKVRHRPEFYGYSSDPQELDNLDATIRFIYSSVTWCNCTTGCNSGKCSCVKSNVKCGDNCHLNPNNGLSMSNCPHQSKDYLKLSN